MFHRLNLNFPPLYIWSLRAFLVCTETKGSGNIASSPVKDMFALWLAFRCRRKCPTQIRGFYAKHGKKCIRNIRNSSFVWGFSRNTARAHPLRESRVFWYMFLVFFQPPWRTSVALGKIHLFQLGWHQALRWRTAWLCVVCVLWQLPSFKDGACDVLGELLWFNSQVTFCSVVDGRVKEHDS